MYLIYDTWLTTQLHPRLQSPAGAHLPSCVPLWRHPMPDVRIQSSKAFRLQSTKVNRKGRVYSDFIATIWPRSSTLCGWDPWSFTTPRSFQWTPRNLTKVQVGPTVLAGDLGLWKQPQILYCTRHSSYCLRWASICNSLLEPQNRPQSDYRSKRRCTELTRFGFNRWMTNFTFLIH